MRKENSEDHSTREKFGKCCVMAGWTIVNLRYRSVNQNRCPLVEIMTTSGMEDMQSNLQDAFSKLFSKKEKKP